MIDRQTDRYQVSSIIPELEKWRQEDPECSLANQSTQSMSSMFIKSPFSKTKREKGLREALNADFWPP